MSKTKFPGFFAYPSYKFGIEIPGRGWIGVSSVSNITKQRVEIPQPPDPITGQPTPPKDRMVVVPITIEGEIIDLKDGARPNDRLTLGDVFLNGFNDRHEVVMVHGLRPEEALKEDGDVVELRRFTLLRCKVLSYTLARHAAAEDGRALEVVAIQPEDVSMETVQSDQVEILTGDGGADEN